MTWRGPAAVNYEWPMEPTVTQYAIYQRLHLSRRNRCVGFAQSVCAGPVNLALDPGSSHA